MSADVHRLSAQLSRSWSGLKSSSFASSAVPTITDSGYLGPLRIIGTALPIAYVWSLPFLARLGFAHMCHGWPQCGPTGASLSDFIANAHATGAMAASFFYPALHMWLNAHQVRYHCYVFPTLAAFQACFGLFLVCPINEAPRLHLVSVYLFCISALIHFGVMLKHCSSDRLWHCQVFLGGAILSVAAILVIQLIPMFKPHVLLDRCPLAFFIAECMGLSSMALFPAVWYREYHRRVANPEPDGSLFTVVNNPFSPDMYKMKHSERVPYWQGTLDKPSHSQPSFPTMDVSFNSVEEFNSALENGNVETKGPPHLLPQPRRFDGMCCLPKVYSPLAPPAIQRPRSIG